MVDLFWISLSGVDRVFLICTLIGGLLFIARGVLGLFGLGDHGADGGVDLSMADLTEGADLSFKVLTLQGITGFFLIFGLTGLALHRGSRVGELASILGALVAGAAMVLLLAKLTQMMQGLHSSGNIDMRQAAGQSALVYLTIPHRGTGQIQISIQGRSRIVDAMSKEDEPIKTGERVEVVEVVNSGLMLVKRA